MEKEIEKLQEKLEQLPEGKLICCQSKQQCKWYQSDGHTKSYIPQSDKDLAEKLAFKKYLTLQLQDLVNEKRALAFYLKHHSPDFEKSIQLLIDNPGYQELLEPYLTPLSQTLANWSRAPYERFAGHPEDLIHKSSSGNMVRSKSEALIDMFLYRNQIPFRYECALHLGETTLFPDFTIRHPQTGEIFYWEHFSLMDKPFYYNNAYSKLQFYASYNIIPSINLITTFETREHPLNIEMVEKTVEYYFL